MRKALFSVRVALAIVLAASPGSSCSWDYLIWIPRKANADPLYRFIKGGKAGYIDQSGNIVVPPMLFYNGFNFGDEFHDGLLSTRNGAYVDKSGRRVIEDAIAWDFSDGFAAARETREGDWGYIDTEGKFAISPRFPQYPSGSVNSFSEGLAAIRIGDAVGYIDRTGNFTIPPRFLDADSFHDGMARVVVEGPCFYSREEETCPNFGAFPKSMKTDDELPLCKYSFIDRAGNVISNERYDYALPFSEGLAPVRRGKLWGYVDKTGAMVTGFRFDKAEPFSDGLALVSEFGQYGYIDRSGIFVIKPQFEHAESFSDGRAVVGSREAGYIYIGHDGNQAIPGEFAIASPFFKGIAHVRHWSGDPEDGRYRYAGSIFSYIDRSGRTVFTYDVSE